MSQKPIPPRVLQAYLEEISRSAAETDVATRKRELLRSYAELKYRISGGGHCSICNTHVRHVLPTTLHRADGINTEYGCLCTRCFEGERALGSSLSVRAGIVTMHYDPQGKVTFEHSAADVPNGTQNAGEE